MTQKEIYDIGIDLTTFLHIAKEAEDPADSSNAAIEMVKGILERYPKLRYEIWQWNQEELLDELGLDYGHP